MKSSKLTGILMILIVLVYLVYSGHYIYQTSHMVNGTRYFTLLDDGMISMRYAKNLASGEGLVWNPGFERVEGFSNPLWVLYMAIFHLFPIPAPKISLAIQITGAALMILNMYLVRRIIQQLTDNWILIYGAVILTGFYGPLNNWSLMGMEVSLLTVMISWTVIKTMQSLENGTFSLVPYLILAVGTLVRFDMAVPFLVYLIFMAIIDPVNRKKHIIWGFGLLAGFLIFQTGLRLWYYGVPLPNTYYLKVPGTPIYVRLGKGLYALVNLIWRTNWIIALLPFSLLFIRRDKPILLLFCVFLGQIAYSVYVGGDAWEHMGGANRYISLGVSGFFILLSLATGEIAKVLSGSFKERSKFSAIAVNLGLILFMFLCLINTNMRIGPQSLRKWLALYPPEFSVASKDYIQIANAISKITTEDASYAVIAAGAIPYYADRYAVDLYGKMDPVIARSESHLGPGWQGIKEFRPGHSKWDAMHSVVELKPDLLIHLIKDPKVTDPRALAFVEENYVIIEIDGYSLTALKDSPNILWHKVDKVY